MSPLLIPFVYVQWFFCFRTILYCFSHCFHSHGLFSQLSHCSHNCSIVLHGHVKGTAFYCVIVTSSTLPRSFRVDVSFNVCVTLAFRYAFASLRVCVALAFRYAFASLHVCFVQRLCCVSVSLRVCFVSRLFCSAFVLR